MTRYAEEEPPAELTEEQLDELGKEIDLGAFGGRLNWKAPIEGGHIDLVRKMREHTKAAERHMRSAKRRADLAIRCQVGLEKRVQHIVSLAHDLTGRPSTSQGDQVGMRYEGFRLGKKRGVIIVEFTESIAKVVEGLGPLPGLRKRCSTVRFPAWYLDARDDVWMQDLINVRTRIAVKTELDKLPEEDRPERFREIMAAMQEKAAHDTANEAALAKALEDTANTSPKSRLVLPGSVALAGLKK